MPKLVVMGAQLKCSFGTAPSALMVIPTGPPVMSSNMLAATIMDFKPMANIMPFLMCMSPSNPVVAAATAAALGVLTPMPCIPVPTAPWSPGAATTTIGGMPALTASSTCNCSWAGVITVIPPGGQATVDVS
jgi:hypothetical protein